MLKQWAKREAISIASKKGIKIRLLISTKIQIVYIYIIITDKVNNKYHGYGMKNTYINVEFHNIQNSRSIET